MAGRSDCRRTTVSSRSFRDFFAWQQQYISSPRTTANTNAPPAAPPAIAAIGGPSFTGDTVAAAASLVAVVAPVVLDAVVDNVLDALVAIVLLEVDPPIAPYALLRSSLFKIAGSRFPLGQLPVLHGFVLQHPRKVLLAVHVLGRYEVSVCLACRWYMRILTRTG